MMTDLIDKIYYRELANQDPEDVCRRVSCKYDIEKKSYTLTVWGDEYMIYPHEYKIERITDTFRNPHAFFYLFIVYYVVKSKEIEISNEWISEKDIPGGATFFRGPHKIPGHLISGRFGNDISAFGKRCEHLQGTPLDMADAAYRFKITLNIPIAVLYWKGDDDFSPEAKILYDRTITEHLTPDMIFSLAIEICTRISG